MIATAIFCQSFSMQSREEILREMERQTVADTNEKTTTTITDENAIPKESDPALSVRIGNRSLDVLESEEGKRSLDIRKHEYQEDYGRYQEDDNERSYRGARNFRGHWTGVEVGFNNYGYNRSMELPQNISYMKLDANNSINLNVNFSQLSIGFGSHIGIVTGIGFNWNNYRFEQANSVGITENGTLGEFIPVSTVPVKRSKFSALYLNAPVLLEVQIPAGYGSHLNLAAGFIGGLKINAWTKIVYEDGEKTRSNGDYNLNLLRGGITARIGYHNLMLYGTYYTTPWFQKLKGPDGFNPEPFEIGLAFTFND